MERVAKPPELLALFDVTAELFDTLKEWFGVPEAVELDLSDIDAAVSQLADPVAIAALAMRKLQGLRLLAQPGVRTSTDVVVTIVQDLDRALIQAPTMRLRRAAQTADWDAELAELLETGADDPAEDPADGPAGGSADDPVGRPSDPDATTAGSDAGEADETGEERDPQVRRFRELHGRLHAAARAVVEVSEGEIRELE